MLQMYLFYICSYTIIRSIVKFKQVNRKLKQVSKFCETMQTSAHLCLCVT